MFRSLAMWRFAAALPFTRRAGVFFPLTFFVGGTLRLRFASFPAATALVVFFRLAGPAPAPYPRAVFLRRFFFGLPLIFPRNNAFTACVC